MFRRSKFAPASDGCNKEFFLYLIVTVTSKELFMKKIKEKIRATQNFVACFLLILIAVLVFISAIARTIHRPINWAQDVSLLAFGWLTFIGADIVINTGNLIRIDILFDKFPDKLKKTIALIFDLVMILFLLILIVYGSILVSQSWDRQFNTLPISYAWCTLSVPIGSAFMLISVFEIFIKDIKHLFNKEVTQ